MGGEPVEPVVRPALHGRQGCCGKPGCGKPGCGKPGCGKPGMRSQEDACVPEGMTAFQGDACPHRRGGRLTALDLIR